MQLFSKIPFTTFPPSGGSVFIRSFLGTENSPPKAASLILGNSDGFEGHVHTKELPPVSVFARRRHTEQS